MARQEHPEGPAEAVDARALIEELFEGWPSGACLLDEEFRVIWFNRKLAELLGIPREQIDGAGPVDSVRAQMARACEDGERDLQDLLAGYRAGAPEDGVCHILAADGREERWLARHSSCVHAGSGRVVWVESYVDITDHKHADAAARRLAASGEEQAFILGNMRGFSYRHDLEGVFHYMSSSVQRLTGYPAEQWMNHYTTYLTDNPVNEEVVEKTERALATGELSDPYLVEIYHADGSRLMLEVAERVYLEAGQVAGIVGVAMDVTARERAEVERRRLEVQLQNSQKLESLGILAGGMAHDFNNLLMVVSGNAELALEELDGESLAHEYLREIATASERATELCRQMLAYSGRGAFLLQPVDLSETMSQAVTLLSGSVSERVKLSCELDPQVPPVEADAVQVKQVALNLLTNACEAIGDAAGEIHVRTGAGELDAAALKALVAAPNLEPGTYAWIEVQDTGTGMDAATLERIFDPFFSTKFAGRGLGLSAVLGVLRGHAGALDVESRLGGGSRFRVLFPAGAAVARSLARPRPPTTPRTGLVLFVDDELAVRTVARAMLEKLGYEVLLANDGLAGLEAFREHSAEIVAVVIDVTMPEMGGDECLLKIRELAPDMPVILASGYDEAEATRKLDRSIAYGFLCKPFAIEVLGAELRAVTGRGPAE